MSTVTRKWADSREGRSVRLVPQAVDQDTSLEEFSSAITDYVCYIGQYDFAAIMLPTTDRKRLQMRGSANFSARHVAAWNTSPASQLVEHPQMVASVRAFLTGQTIPVPTTRTDQNFVDNWPAESQAEGYNAVLSTPLPSSYGPIGVLTVYLRQDHEFSGAERGFLEAVASLIALAVETKQLADRAAESLEAFQQAGELHRELIQASTLDEVLWLLRERTNTDPWFLNQQGDPWPSPRPADVSGRPTWLPRPLARKLIDRLQDLPEGRVETIAATTNTLGVLGIRLPVSSHGPTALVCPMSQALAPEALALSLQEASLIVGRIEAEQRRRQADERELESEVVEGLIHGYYAESSYLQRRASVLGLNSDIRYAVVLLKGNAPTDEAAGSSSYRSWSELATRIKRATGSLMQESPRGQQSVTFLMPERSDNGDPTELFWKMCSSTHAGAVAVGAGEYRSLIDVSTSYLQAQRSLQVLQTIGEGVGRMWYPKVGVLGVLAGAAGSAELGLFCRSLLGPVRDYDANHRGELVSTLRDYFQLGQGVKATARARYVHPNSIYYRLRKVEELTGLDLSRREDSLQMQLALLVDELTADKNADPRAASRSSDGSVVRRLPQSR